MRLLNQKLKTMKPFQISLLRTRIESVRDRMDKLIDSSTWKDKKELQGERGDLQLLREEVEKIAKHLRKIGY
jgi:hypothetical protein